MNELACASCGRIFPSDLLDVEGRCPECQLLAAERDYSALVRKIMATAYRRLGSNAQAVVDVLSGLGLRSKRRRPYSTHAVLHWMRGTAKPDPEVVLALAVVTQQSIDKLLGLGDQPANADDEQAELTETLRTLTIRIGRIMPDLTRLLGAGQLPAPPASPAPRPTARRPRRNQAQGHNSP